MRRCDRGAMLCMGCPSAPSRGPVTMGRLRSRTLVPLGGPPTRSASGSREAVNGPGDTRCRQASHIGRRARLHASSMARVRLSRSPCLALRGTHGGRSRPVAEAGRAGVMPQRCAYRRKPRADVPAAARVAWAIGATAIQAVAGGRFPRELGSEIEPAWRSRCPPESPRSSTACSRPSRSRSRHRRPLAPPRSFPTISTTGMSPTGP